MFFKKLFSVAAALSLLALLCAPVALAEPVAEPDMSLAPSAILMEASSGEVLYEKNCDTPMPPASVTKIMTLLLTMEALDSGKIKLTDKVTASSHANSMPGARIWLEVGESMTVNDLVKATAISSANDASVALAEYLSGSEDAFVQVMNNRGKELKMKNTCFKNASGLDAAGHTTTSRDIAIMSRELLKHPLILGYTTVWMDSLRDGKTSLVNTNKLIRFYKGATGLKTGTTEGAGNCLSATATKGGMTIIAVVMGAKTSDDRFNAARTLLDYGFANWSVTIPKPYDGELAPVKVLKGVQASVDVVAGTPSPIVCQKGETKKIDYDVILCDDVMAPVEQGQILGKVNLLVNGKNVGSYDLAAANEVKRVTFGYTFVQLLRCALRLR